MANAKQLLKTFYQAQTILYVYKCFLVYNLKIYEHMSQDTKKKRIEESG